MVSKKLLLTCFKRHACLEEQAMLFFLDLSVQITWISFDFESKKIFCSIINIYLFDSFV